MPEGQIPPLLRVIARNVREELIAEDPNNHHPENEWGQGFCAIASNRLVSRAKKAGFSGEITLAANYTHAWAEWKGWIIDITATQFPEIEEPVYVTKQNLTKQRYISFCVGYEAERFFKSWPTRQQPSWWEEIFGEITEA